VIVAKHHTCINVTSYLFVDVAFSLLALISVLVNLALPFTVNGLRTPFRATRSILQLISKVDVTPMFSIYNLASWAEFLRFYSRNPTGY
jgi:hypothetical protein